MPRKYLMGFDVDKRRWRKSSKGERYEVYCSELGLAEDQWTEQGSYQAANKWWLDRTKVIASGVRAVPPEAQRVIDELTLRAAILDREGEDSAEYRGRVGDAYADPANAQQADPVAEARIRKLSALGVDLDGLSPADLDEVLGANDYWRDRKVRQPAGRQVLTIGQALTSWTELLATRCKPTTMGGLQSYSKLFVGLKNGARVVLSKDMDVRSIDEDKVREVYVTVAGWKLGAGTKLKQFVYFQSFVRHLVELGKIEAPKNLDSKNFEFRVSTESKEPADRVAILTFIRSVPDRLQLYAYLALNCSMNNVDIGKLRHGQIDWAQGTLTRKRVKTETAKRAPTVTYKLWAETSRLLRKEQNSAAEFVLTDGSGEPLYISEFVEGRPKHYDKIKSQWRDYFKRKGVEKQFTMMDFRFFGADLLAGSEYDSYRTAYLGHCPKEVLDKHYSASSNVTKACEYLEELLFGPTELKVQG